MAARFQRNLRLGEFNLLFLGAFLVAVALSTVGTFSERMEQTMQEKTRALLGADAMVSSPRPIDPELVELASEFDLEVAQTISFLSMVVTADGSQLAGIRAVTPNYPLRGSVTLQPQTEVPESAAVTAGPTPGSIWAAVQLVSALSLEDDQSVELGTQNLAFQGTILAEPEGGAGMLRLAPRVIMNLDDAQQSGLLAPGSRARYRLLFAGEETSLQAFQDALLPILKDHENWQLADIRREEVRGTVGRIVSYIQLAVLLSVILSIVAMTLAAQGLWGRQINEIALLRCLGQSHGTTLRQMTRTYLQAIVPVALAGVATGYGVQELAARFVGSVTGIALSPASLVPAAWTLVLCVVAVAAVVLPLMFATRQVPPVILIRESQTDRVNSYGLTLVSVFVLITLVTLILAEDIVLSAYVLGGILATGVLMWGISRTLFSIARRSTRPRPTPAFAALKSLAANGNRSAWIASTFGSVAFAMVLLGVLRIDILQSWEDSVPEDAPNLFVINIKEGDLSPLQTWLQEQGVPEVLIYAIIRGRISRVNDQPVADMDFDSAEARHHITHEYNLTESADLPEGNVILDGRWNPESEPGFSVEVETAEALALKVGDELSLDIAGQLITAPITSTRQVDWESMRSNFYIIGSPGLFEGTPRTFISGITAPGNPGEFASKLGKTFTGVTAINLDMVLSRFRDLVNQGSKAISSVFVFTLVSAALVFAAILQGQSTARAKEIALMKTLGAGARFVRRYTFLEMTLLGGMAGFLGGTLAVATGVGLATYLFDLDIGFPWEWVATSTLVGMILVSLVGYLSIRKTLSALPTALLKGSNFNPEFLRGESA